MSVHLAEEKTSDMFRRSLRNRMREWMANCHPILKGIGLRVPEGGPMAPAQAAFESTS